MTVVTHFSISLLVAVVSTQAEIEKPGTFPIHINPDGVGTLPGVNFRLDFNQYSGYLNVTENHRYHYWLVEARTADPAKSPLLLWLNGGPGCSSLIALFGENGPFRIDWKGETVVENVYAWNKVANVLYLESPAGVGFSYSVDGKADFNDSSVAEENHMALLKFFEKYPIYNESEIFISGESYAGVYIPSLAAKILADKNFPAKFMGVAIGNGIYDSRINTNSVLDYFFYHGVFGNLIMDAMRKDCNCGQSYICDYMSNAKFNMSTNPPIPLNDCAKDILKAFGNTGGLDGYNIYDSCYEEPTYSFASGDEVTLLTKPSRYISLADFPSFINPVKDPDHCNLTYNPLAKYFNKTEVRTALHIPKEVHAWKSCGGLTSYSNDLLKNTMKPFFETMLAAKLNILVYHGDFDSVCGFMEGQRFLGGLKLTHAGPRKQWAYKYDTIGIAGYWDEFKENLDFLTVRGAGHFVPSDKPREALQMIGNFIAGTRDYSKEVKVNLQPASTTPEVPTTTPKHGGAERTVSILNWLILGVLLINVLQAFY